MSRVTVRGMRTILTKAKIDHSTLDMTEVRVTLDGHPETRVVVRGPRAARHAAFMVLLDRGLVVAPFPEYDEWGRS